MEQFKSPKKRGRPEKLEQYGQRDALTRLWQAHPEMKDRELRDEQRKTLFRKVSEAHDGWTPKQIALEVNEWLPSVATIGDFRRDELEPNQERVRAEGKDAPWHMGLTTAHPLSPDVIARVLSLKAWLRSKKQPEAVTTREVSWIERLYVTLPANDDLWLAVQQYSSLELVFDLHGGGSPLDTTDLDKTIAPGMYRRDLKSDDGGYKMHKAMRDF
jgi:hypothetical protein